MLIGTATSAHQIEGNNVNSDWWHFEMKGRLKYRSGIACDSYGRYADDIKLMKKLRLNSYRFSIEFSRIMPDRYSIDYDAIKHYKSVIADLKRNGIEPIPTLWHYTLPFWFYRLGGFENSRNIANFIRYVKLLLKEGIDTKYIITINEPMVYAIKAYLNGRYPPFKHSFRTMLHVVNNLIRLHNELYTLLKKEGYTVSFAKNLLYFGKISKVYLPFGFSEYYYNKRFIKHSKIDFLGMNYYHNIDVFKTVRRKNKKTDMGWTIYSRGMRSLAEYYYHTYKKPIMVTENGIATGDEVLRGEFITEHVNTLVDMEKSGIPVLGYHYWSLLDNFEWDYGYTKKFGICYVDSKSKQRIMKSSASVLKDLALKYG
ncbi:MAG: family 1 glycosylhydrolase [Candidatus Parvarchaeota archaeon]|nr:family 1 glycosylhydrolase [Candidatus Parvarchaeota archaeon]